MRRCRVWSAAMVSGSVMGVIRNGRTPARAACRKPNRSPRLCSTASPIIATSSRPGNLRPFSNAGRPRPAIVRLMFATGCSSRRPAQFPAVSALADSKRLFGASASLPRQSDRSRAADNRLRAAQHPPVPVAWHIRDVQSEYAREADLSSLPRDQRRTGFAMDRIARTRP